MLKAIDDYLEETILLILLVLMTCIMGIQIVSRYVFQNSLTWSEELVRYMFVWSAFLGVPFCIKHRLSIKVDQFRNLFPIPLQKVLMYIDKIIIFLLFLVLFIYSGKSNLSKWTNKSSNAITNVDSSNFSYCILFIIYDSFYSKSFTLS